MIKIISEYIDSKIIQYVEKFYPLVKILTDGDMTFPAFYKGKGNYEHINIDNFNGLAYLRMNGDPTSSAGVDEHTACALIMNTVYPVRLVFSIHRDALKTDNAFSEDIFIQTMLSDLTTKNGILKANLKARQVTLFPESWTTSSQDVLSQEYSGIKLPDINYNYIYGAINFNTQITIDAKCLPLICEDACYS